MADHKRMAKFANVLDTAAKVGTKVFLTVTIVCAVFAVLVLVLGGAVMEPGSFVLELDFVKLHLADEYQTVTPMMRLFTAVGLITASVLLFCVQYGLRIVRRILEPMKEGRPFDMDTPINIGKLAWLVFIGGTVAHLLGIAGQVILVLALPMEQILVTSAVTELEFAFRGDYGFVLAFLLLRLTAYVFAYGQKLQQESDETL